MTLESPFSLLILTDENILRMFQQILRLLIVCIEDEFNLLKMQDDTFVAQYDVFSWSRPQQATVSSTMRSTGS